MDIENEKINKLISSAVEVRKNSYSPYSRFAVGASVLAKSGKIYSGTNVENSSFGSTICAERSAIFCAISAGEIELVALVVVAENNPYPCGACRQVFAEFSSADANVIIANTDGKIIDRTTIGELLPHSFKFGKI
ncbi:cytidine deaminase [bacterium]|nr:cytidine deaminase [bacterium]